MLGVKVLFAFMDKTVTGWGRLGLLIKRFNFTEITGNKKPAAWPVFY